MHHNPLTYLICSIITQQQERSGSEDWITTISWEKVIYNKTQFAQRSRKADPRVQTHYYENKNLKLNSQLQFFL